MRVVLNIAFVCINKISFVILGPSFAFYSGALLILAYIFNKNNEFYYILYFECSCWYLGILQNIAKSGIMKR